MLDQIISSVKGELSNVLGEKFQLPADKVDQASSLATESVLESVTSSASEGGLSNILNLFNGKESIASSGFVKTLIGNYGSKLISKLGVSSEMASTISNFAIPFIMNKINDNTPSEGIEESTLTSLIGGGIADSLKGKLGGLFG